MTTKTENILEPAGRTAAEPTAGAVTRTMERVIAPGRDPNAEVRSGAHVARYEYRLTDLAVTLRYTIVTGRKRASGTLSVNAQYLVFAVYRMRFNFCDIMRNIVQQSESQKGNSNTVQSQRGISDRQICSMYTRITFD